MSHAFHASLNLPYIRRASMVAGAQFVTMSTSLLVILLARGTYGHEFTTVVGLVGALYGLAAVVSSGIMVSVLAQCTRPLAIAQKTGDAKPFFIAVQAEARGACTLALVYVTAGFLLILVGPALLALPPDVFRPHWVPMIGALAFAPFLSLLQGLVQSLSLDGFALKRALLMVPVVVLAVLLPILLGASLATALFVSGLAQLAVTIGLLLMSCRAVNKELRQRLKAQLRREHLLVRPAREIRTLFRQAAGALDGVVFIVTFSLAIAVASHHSAADGAVIALVVSVMRTLIVPAKQFGLVGGRLERLGKLAPGGGDSERPVALGTVITSSGLVFLTGALVVGLLNLSGVLHGIPKLIMAMMLIQIVLEPLSGVLFSFIKVVRGPEASLAAVLVPYGGLVIPGMLIAGMTGSASAVVLWTIAFTGRLLFLGASVVSALRWAGGEEAASQESSPKTSSRG